MERPGRLDAEPDGPGVARSPGPSANTCSRGTRTPIQQSFPASVAVQRSRGRVVRRCSPPSLVHRNCPGFEPRLSEHPLLVQVSGANAPAAPAVPWDQGPSPATSSSFPGPGCISLGTIDGARYILVSVPGRHANAHVVSLSRTDFGGVVHRYGSSTGTSTEDTQTQTARGRLGQGTAAGGPVSPGGWASRIPPWKSWSGPGQKGVGST